MDNKFSIKVDGEVIEYTIIRIITPLNSKHKYVVYTDNGSDVYASRFKMIGKNIVLEDIEHQYEFDMIDEVMEGE